MKATLSSASTTILRSQIARQYSMGTSAVKVVKQVEDALLGDHSPRKPRAEGTIASVFASLSGEKAVPLPERFTELKRELLHSQDLQNAVSTAWIDLCQHLSKKTREIAHAGNSIIPEIEYKDIVHGVDPSVLEEIKASGTLVVRGVVQEQKALEWLEAIKQYIALNPQVKGFPEDDKAVFELNSTSDDQVSFSVPLTYCDRLRIRRPGDSKFALGAHVDGGSVERWEDPTYRRSYQSILEGRWRDHDAWDIGGRPTANQNLYDGPGACGIFRAFQGWTSLSDTGPGEGTLKVFPAIKESTAYIMLRPFFKANQPRLSLSQEAYLDPSNWSLDLESPTFPGSPLGRSQELNDDTHPHLRLNETLMSMKRVKPGDQVWWHCDGIHAVESEHTGSNASSVLYIPSVPLTEANARYIKDQRDTYLNRIPPPDFPGGEGEKFFQGTGEDSDIVTEQGKRAMGLAPLDLEGTEASEKLLRQKV
ncbi:hypothetical protein QFC19_005833 [Naganishia cerealis]|uniref:Uncharacterized protein n=1 Tax=Naganishia cerealis TaxID=610337 RepID=A0ACC2VKS7_9TREE|nr:hypothetical protein QFC19_005833 [Naganishia cerealis]